MAAIFRQPLAPRTAPQLPPIIAPSTLSKASILKRPRSPDIHSQNAIHDPAATKKFRTSSATTKENVDKECRRAERENLKEEFRYKYTKAFPSWTFYFDTTDAERDALVPRVLYLHGRVAKFFSNEVTHFITNGPVPDASVEVNKENTGRLKATSGASLKSPIKLRVFPDENASLGHDTLTRKAKQFGMKIWDTAKLDSVLTRCSVPALLPGVVPQQPRSLTSLLESEKRHGTTTERDPTTKRHDYHYFSKGTYFVLVEDMRQELATIAALEYAVTRTSDGKEKGSWPVAHCHPLSRGPFVEYNEKEERRRERQERAERERERAEEIRVLKFKQVQRKKQDLRRSVSMSNLQRQATTNVESICGEPFEMIEPLGGHTGNAASGFDSTATCGSYIAASGNSVSIASTYGTTSTMGIGSSMRSGVAGGLPASLAGRMANQVVTSRRVMEPDTTMSRSASFSKPSASSAMMPPPDLPDQSRKSLLRKCKSTNTLRLGKRDEKSKPGYCESCRQKFEDFKQHVRGRRHQKFASSDANYLQLDCLLNRIRRQAKTEVEEAELQLLAQTTEEALADAMMPEDDIRSELVDDSKPMNVDDEKDYIYLDSDEDS